MQLQLFLLDSFKRFDCLASADERKNERDRVQSPLSHSLCNPMVPGSIPVQVVHSMLSAKAAEITKYKRTIKKDNKFFFSETVTTLLPIS